MSLLTHEIIKHILTKLGTFNVLNSIYTSITDPDFLQDRTILLTNEEDEDIENNIWSCKLSLEEKKFRLLLADMSTIEGKEYALIVSLEGSPEYGCYYSETSPNLSFIASYVNGMWIQSTVYVQSAFLTGMEQIKDLSIPWSYNSEIDDLYDKLVNFVNYHNEVLT